MTSRPRLALRPARVPTLEVPRERFALSCGARLVVSPRSGAPITAIKLRFRGGRSQEPEGKAGLGALVGGLVDQGTKRHDEAELAALLEPAGGALAGGPGGLSGAIAGGSWKLLLELACEMATVPTYPATLVELHKRRVLSRLAVLVEEPRAQAEQRFRRLVYGNHWLGRPGSGTIESVSVLTPRDLRSHHARLWVPNRCIIAVCGDVDPKAVRRHLERLLADWKPRGLRESPAAPIPARATRVAAFPRQREQVHVYLGHLGIERKHPDYAALTVMDHVLGTGPGFTNRITRRLRDELGLAYAVSADIHSSAGDHPGTFAAYIGTSPEHVGTAVEGFLAEIHRIQDEPVASEELETAKSYLLGSFALGFERAARRASYLVNAEVFGFPDDYLEILPRQFAAVTVEDIQRVAREHLHPDACVLSAGGPTTKKELARLVGGRTRKR